MEHTAKTETIKEITGQHPSLQKVQTLESYNDIELTPEEQELALHTAKKVKYHRLKEKEYFDKVNAERQPLKMNTEDFRKYATQSGKDLMWWSSEKEFVLDDFRKPVFDALCLYFSGDPEFEKLAPGFSLRKGILLYGFVGVGKTKMMEIFKANPISSYHVISCTKITDAVMTEGPEALHRYVGIGHGMPNYFRHNEFDFCFDDLGTESKAKYFGNDIYVMERVLQMRYEANRTTHITTNLTGEQIAETYGMRIRSRLREMCNVIKFDKAANDLR